MGLSILIFGNLENFPTAEEKKKTTNPPTNPFPYSALNEFELCSSYGSKYVRKGKVLTAGGRFWKRKEHSWTA